MTEPQSTVPRVTICLAAYNAEAFIESTLDSIASQTFPDFIVQIALDVSTDQTQEIVEQYCEKDPRFSVLIQTERQGWIDNLNSVMRDVQTDYLMIAPHDDLLLPSCLERLVSILDQNPDATNAFGDMKCVVESYGEEWDMGYDRLEGTNTAFERARVLVSRGGDWWAPYRGLVRTSAARDVGWMRKNPVGEFIADWYFILALATRGPLIRCPEVLFKKRLQPQSLSVVWNKGSFFNHFGGLCGGVSALRRSPLNVFQELRLFPPMFLSGIRMAIRHKRRDLSYKKRDQQ